MGNTSLSGSYPVLIEDIRLAAYKIQYEASVIRALCKPIAKNDHGNAVQYSYWDPNSDTLAGVATEGTALSATDTYVNASVYLVASEFAERSLITMNIGEDQMRGADISGEHSRRHGIAHSIAVETKLKTHFSSFGSTVTATSSTGLTIGKVMNASSLLAARKGLVPTPYNLVVHPYAWNLLAISMTSNSNYGVQGDVGNEVLKKHLVTSLLGEVNVYHSRQVAIASSIATCGLFAKDAIGVWTPRAFTMKTDEDIDLRANKIVSTQRVGSALLHSGFGVKMSLYAGTPA